MIEKEVDKRYVCEMCDEKHDDWHREVYNHNPRLHDLFVCERCGCGTEPHEIRT